MATCNYKPARMKHRVTLQSVVQFPDGQGGFTESWEDDADLWAEVTPLRGWELMKAQQLQASVTHKVALRYRAGITPANRLLYGDRIFEIKQAINVDEANAYLDLLCLETVALDTGVTVLMQDNARSLFQDGNAISF